MNIVEAFIKFFGQMIILISGLSGSNKTKIARFIEKNFKIKFINIEKYLKQNDLPTKELNNGIKIIDYDNINSFDWDKINEDIDKYKSSGVVICGPYFPECEITSNVNFHIQIKVPKQILIEKRLEYIKKNPDKFEGLENKIDYQLISKIINDITYPHFIDYTAKSKIDKYVNSKDLTVDQIYDQVVNYLFYRIKEDLKERDKKVIEQTNIKPELSKEYDYGERYYDFNDKIPFEKDREGSIYLGELDNEENEWQYCRTGMKIKDPNYGKKEDLEKF